MTQQRDEIYLKSQLEQQRQNLRQLQGQQEVFAIALPVHAKDLIE